MSRSVFKCPNCGPAVGTLLDGEGMPIRCDHKVRGWHSVRVGFDEKRQVGLFEHTPRSEPGCGGTLRLCQHGQRACVACEPRFEAAKEPASKYVPLATVVEAERRAAARAKEESARAERETKRSTPSPTFTPPSGKVQIPFLGEPEPNTYRPPTNRSKKR